MSVRKKIPPNRSNRLANIRNIYINVLFYHIDEFLPISTLAYSTALSFSNSEVWSKIRIVHSLLAKL